MNCKIRKWNNTLSKLHSSHIPAWCIDFGNLVIEQGIWENVYITKYIAIEPMVAEINWTLENLNKEYGKIIVTKYVVAEIKWTLPNGTKLLLNMYLVIISHAVRWIFN